MTIDLSKAKKGDTVHFRCGVKAVVKNSAKNSYELTALITEHGDDTWYNDGKHCTYGKHPLDIIRIEPAPFDWKDVKPGMAFKAHMLKHAVHYIAPHLCEDDMGIFALGGMARTLYVDLKKKGLTRAPEHDIQVSE